MANIYGTNKDDTLKGTKYDDNIYAYSCCSKKSI
jgi:hypothetical protein